MTQEIIAFGIVAVAALFTALRFMRQFTRGDQAPKCSKCELYKAVKDNPPPMGRRKASGKSL